MSQRKMALAIGEHYHIYNRGNNRQKIFFDIQDHVRFQELLYAVNTTKNITLRLIDKEERFLFDRGDELVSIGAYCLMPNHFHILITPLIENGIQRFVQKLSTGYSMYFNKRYERTGSLFEGRFKSEHADSDEYLKYLFSYIHLNPLKIFKSDWRESLPWNTQAGEFFLSEYRFSSHLDYLGKKRLESNIISPEDFPNYFPDSDTFLDEIKSWIYYNEKE